MTNTVFKNEAFALLAILVYFALYYVGKKINEKRANSWSVSILTTFLFNRLITYVL